MRSSSGGSDTSGRPGVGGKVGLTGQTRFGPFFEGEPRRHLFQKFKNWMVVSTMAVLIGLISLVERR